MRRSRSSAGARDSGRPSKKRVVILGLPPVDALDVIGPAEVFAAANQLRPGGQVPYTLELISAALDVCVASQTGIGLVGHRTLRQEVEEAKPIDTLIVTSGFWAQDHPNKPAIEWLRQRSASVRRVCSICVGAFTLAEAGLLDGRRATTHWRLAQQMADRYPRVQVDPNPIWVKDGNLYTSAGISAGIDLALSLVGEDLGDDVAQGIAQDLVLFLRRPAGQAQFSVALRSQQAPASSLDELCVWISENLDADLTVENLADRCSTSVRTLIRMFQRDWRNTPAKYVEAVRIEAACRAVEVGGQLTEEVARKCGYRSVDVLRKAFLRRVGVSPKDYAKRFVQDS